MKIETKYEIGQHIWIIYENRDTINLYDTYIDSIGYDKDGLVYYTKEADDYFEEQIILYEDKEKLLQKIEETTQRIHEREDKNLLAINT